VPKSSNYYVCLQGSHQIKSFKCKWWWYTVRERLFYLRLCQNNVLKTPSDKTKCIMNCNKILSSHVFFRWIHVVPAKIISLYQLSLTQKVCGPCTKRSHKDIPGWCAFVEIATKNECDAQRDGNRGQEQVSHVHRRLQQNTWILEMSGMKDIPLPNCYGCFSWEYKYKNGACP
jgi:hypothetical protein